MDVQITSARSGSKMHYVGHVEKPIRDFPSSCDAALGRAQALNMPDPARFASSAAIFDF